MEVINGWEEKRRRTSPPFGALSWDLPPADYFRKPIFSYVERWIKCTE